MKLSELRACDGCGGSLLARGSIQFFTVSVGSELVDGQALHGLQTLLHQFHGNVAIAEAMAPESDITKPVPPTKLLLCFDCLCTPQVLASLTEARVDREEKAERAAESKR